MLFFLLIMVFSINALTLYIIFKTGSHSLFDKIMCYSVVTLLLHSAYAFIARYYFAELTFVDRGAPFGLLYGPLLYFAAFSNNAKQLKRRNITPHLLPFLLATLIYSYYLAQPVLRKETGIYYYGILYSGKTLSMVGYVIFIFLNQKNITTDVSLRKLINSAAIWLILIASLFASIIISRVIKQKNIGVILPGILVYGSMLFVSLLIFKYAINRLFTLIKTTDTFQDNANQHVTRQYKKSSLTTDILREYELKLDKAMQNDMVFLDTELSLDSLSKKVKIPKHHLTQLFNTRINQSFYQYINTFRVNYSCMLLKEEPGTNLEEIAFRSGFNSKVSFNRYFKNQMNCTPSEYKQQQ